MSSEAGQRHLELCKKVKTAERFYSHGDIQNSLWTIKDILNEYRHNEIKNVPANMEHDCVFGIYARIVYLRAKSIGDLNYRSQEALKNLKLLFAVFEHQGINKKNMTALYCKYKALYHLIVGQIKKRALNVSNCDSQQNALATATVLPSFEMIESDTSIDIDSNETSNNNNDDTNTNDNNSNNEENKENNTASQPNIKKEEKSVSKKNMDDKAKARKYGKKAYELSNGKSATICAWYGFDLCFESSQKEDKMKGIEILKQSLNIEFEEYAIGNLASALCNNDQYDEAFEWIDKGYKFIENENMLHCCGVYLRRHHGSLLLQSLYSLERNNANDDTKDDRKSDEKNDEKTDTNTSEHDDNEAEKEKEKESRDDQLTENENSKKEKETETESKSKKSKQEIEKEKERRIELALLKFEEAVNLDKKIWGQWIGNDLFAYKSLANALYKHKKDYKNAKKYFEIAIKIDQCLFWYVKDYWIKNDETIENIYIPNDIWNIIVMYWYIPQGDNNNLTRQYAELMEKHFENGQEKAKMYYSLSFMNTSERVYLVKGIDDGRNAWYYVLVEQGKMDGFLKALNDDIIHLEDWSQILYSAYGDHPPQEITDQLKEKYGID